MEHGISLLLVKFCLKVGLLLFMSAFLRFLAMDSGAEISLSAFENHKVNLIKKHLAFASEQS